MTYTAYVPLSTTIQYNISPLYAQYKQCVHVNMEWILLHILFYFGQRTTAFLSHCTDQAIMSYVKITIV